MGTRLLKIKPKFTVSFVIEGDLCSWKRMGENAQGKRFESREVKTWKGRIQSLFLGAVLSDPYTFELKSMLPWDGPVAVQLHAEFTMPKGRPQWWKAAAFYSVIPCERELDTDNIEKGIFDALEKHAYTNDKRICANLTRKTWNIRDSIAVQIEFYPEITRVNYGG